MVSGQCRQPEHVRRELFDVLEIFVVRVSRYLCPPPGKLDRLGFDHLISSHSFDAVPVVLREQSSLHGFGACGKKSCNTKRTKKRKLTRRKKIGRSFLERLHPDWKIIGIRRAAPASCLQSICISLKPPAHEGRFQSG
jgi:hypothetical protein